MPSVENQLQEVLTELGQVLCNPEAFGLGPSVPQPLADLLKAILAKLNWIMNGQNEQIPEEDLASELSQDADSSLDPKPQN